MMLVCFALGPVFSALLRAGSSSNALVRALIEGARRGLLFQLAGILLALAWRTPALQPAALKLADGALVALAGIFLGFFLAGRPKWLFKPVGAVPAGGALVGGALLVAGLVAPNPLSWALPLLLSVGAGLWAARRRALPILLCAIGAFGNELVRGLNGGFMPVEGSGLMSGLGVSNTYVVADAGTVLPWLADRFHLPAPFPGIASLGDMVIAIGVVWLVATVVGRRHTLIVPRYSEDRLAGQTAA
jgi:hypothetical protein